VTDSSGVERTRPKTYLVVEAALLVVGLVVFVVLACEGR